MTKQEVDKLGKKILRKLGKGWKYTIWENLGWHVHWINGSITLNCCTYTGENMFYYMIGPPNSAVGHIDFTSIESYKDPSKAVKAGIVEAERVIENHWMPIINSIQKLKKECTNENLECPN